MTVEKIPRVRPPYPFEDYRFEIRPLSRAEGGGFLISFPDLAGCISDGETISEAVRHGKEAFQSWVSARIQDAIPVPEPSRLEGRPLDEYSGRFVQRIPRSLHAELAARAEAEGVSLNSLVLALIANGLGRLRQARSHRDDLAVVAEPTPTYRTGKGTRATAARRPRKN
jgi:antitoxin HicB